MGQTKGLEGRSDSGLETQACDFFEQDPCPPDLHPAFWTAESQDPQEAACRWGQSLKRANRWSPTLVMPSCKPGGMAQASFRSMWTGTERYGLLKLLISSDETHETSEVPRT